MIELHLPWLDLSILLALVGAIWVGRRRNIERARRDALIVSAAVLGCAIGAWQDFGTLHTFEAHDWGDVLGTVGGRDLLVIDELSAPLVPLAALLYLLTILSTLLTKAQRFSFAWALAGEAILLATLSCRAPWGLVALLAAGTLPPLVDLLRRRKPVRVYLLHMGLFVLLLVAGQGMIALSTPGSAPSLAGVSLLMAAVLLRSGVVPVHCWMTDLFEHASFGTALLTVTPMVGAYAAMRLVLPIAPDWVLHSIAIFSLVTAVYAAGMALVQHEARRFFCYLFLSNSSLVLVGLEIATPIGLTGALCVWQSVAMSLTGFGLTLRCVEARTGRLSLDAFHGLYEQTPMLAAFFLLTGLASIGFPGTIGFIGAELLVEGGIGINPIAGTAMVVAAALNGLAVLHAYFRVFTGTRHVASIDLAICMPERIAVLILTVLLLGGGIYPQPGVTSRYHAAQRLVEQRARQLPGDAGQATALRGALSEHVTSSTLAPARRPVATSPPAPR
ncbi:MAG: oxidoreductase [Planctomycetaceae bacterium]|nr:oxidoreductase [Planctomycetaceae bacterium]